MTVIEQIERDETVRRLEGLLDGAEERARMAQELAEKLVFERESIQRRSVMAIAFLEGELRKHDEEDRWRETSRVVAFILLGGEPPEVEEL